MVGAFVLLGPEQDLRRLPWLRRSGIAASLFANLICQDTPEVVEPTKVIPANFRADFRAGLWTSLFLGEIVDVEQTVRRKGQQRTVGQFVDRLRSIDHVVQPFVFTQLQHLDAVAVEFASKSESRQDQDLAALSDSIVSFV